MSENKVIIKQLIEFGLSDKEAKVYLALIELEVATVTEISKTANIKRSSTYVVLESLKEKGLVSMSEDKKVQNYVAISPDMLLLEAQTRAKKAEDIKIKISEIVPELKALHKDTKQKPIVKVFEGKQGVMNSMSESLECDEKLIRVCSSHESWLNEYPDFKEFIIDYVKRRHKLGIKMHSIHPDTDVAIQLTKMNPFEFDKTVLIPKLKYKFPAELAIWDNKIGYVSPDKRGFAMTIESKEIAEVMKTLFDLAYEEAKRIKNINKLVGEYKESLDEYKPKVK